MNPFMRVVYGIVGLGVFGVMLMLGTMFFVVFAAIALVGGSVLAARIWWLSRRAEKTLRGSFEQAHRHQSNPSQGQNPNRGSAQPGSVIEGEYSVVDKPTQPDSER